MVAKCSIHSFSHSAQAKKKDIVILPLNLLLISFLNLSSSSGEWGPPVAEIECALGAERNETQFQDLV